MNRPLKFRAWDGEEMIYEDDAAAITTPYRNDQLATFFADNYGCDIMQFTGLLDSEGTEIYEGDVLGGEMIRRVVVWHTEEAAWMAQCPGSMNEWLGLNEVFGVVLGNVFESPNLLEEG